MGAPVRAAQYLAGRWLLRRMCALACDVAIESIGLNAEGAPLASGPLGVELPRLSLTHSGDWLAVAANFGPIGVDLERWGSRRDWPGLALHLDMVGNAGETAVLKTWTLQEALFKAGNHAGEVLAVRRFETPDYLACLVAPPGPEPLCYYFCGAGPVSWHEEI